MTLKEKIVENSFSRLDKETDREKTADIIEAIVTTSTAVYQDGSAHGRKIPEEIRRRIQDTENPVLKSMYDRISNAGVDASKVFFSPANEWSMYVFRNINQIYGYCQNVSHKYCYQQKFPLEPPEKYLQEIYGRS